MTKESHYIIYGRKEGGKGVTEGRRNEEREKRGRRKGDRKGKTS